MTCRKAHVLIQLNIDDRLKPSAQSALREHLNGCEACRREAEGLQVLRRSLQALDQTPPYDLDIKVYQAIARASKMPPRFTGIRRAAAGMAMVCLLSLGATAYGFTQTGLQDNLIKQLTPMPQSSMMATTEEEQAERYTSEKPVSPEARGTVEAEKSADMLDNDTGDISEDQTADDAPVQNDTGAGEPEMGILSDAGAAERLAGASNSSDESTNKGSGWIFYAGMTAFILSILGFIALFLVYRHKKRHIIQS